MIDFSIDMDFLVELEVATGHGNWEVFSRELTIPATPAAPLRAANRLYVEVARMLRRRSITTRNITITPLFGRSV